MFAKTNTAPAKALDRNWQHMPFRYIFASFVMLSIFIVGVVLPDIMPYIGPRLGLTPSSAAVAGASAQAAPLISPSHTPDTFETYARLVTLLLALVSVLGVFFGYFVRKSLRETEDDLDKRFDRQMMLWEKERDALLKRYGDDADELEKSIKTVTTLEKQMRDSFEDLNSAKERYSKPAPQTEPIIIDVAAAVDQRLGEVTGGPS